MKYPILSSLIRQTGSTTMTPRDAARTVRIQSQVDQARLEEVYPGLLKECHLALPDNILIAEISNELRSYAERQTFASILD